ncbi:ATP synthase membrane subunit K, mitochondrial-like [Leguminivora glycinivorella]|uniref:ATP synthase membrane subunit K, mitochondrial-like n=1 Tax=Leguminivora glycinivorella TaxID=1035111 RepID=UPI0020102C43|nr:ATP synthase membrane subunit K, mitochondrial-like [Leguminivora glycinivorella]
MAGHGVDDDPNLKGITRYFNSTTTRGRANVTKVTYTFLALYYLYSKIRPKPSKPKSK